MLHPFSRTELLLGSEAVDRLRRAHVAVFGLGGVGSFAAEALARAAIGALTIIDADTVSVTNRNRQLLALSSTTGRPKTDVMAERIGDINPDCKVTPLSLFYTPESTLDLKRHRAKCH